MFGIDEALFVGIAYAIGKFFYYALKKIYEGKDGIGKATYGVAS